MCSRILKWIVMYFVVNFQGTRNIGFKRVLGTTERHDGICSTQLCPSRYHGITKSRCERSSCCWDLSKQDCYELREPKCQIGKSKRTTCPDTWYGYPQKRCEKKGCCFDEESNSCYQSKPDSILEGKNVFTAGQVARCGEAELSLSNGKMMCKMIEEVYTCNALCNERFELFGESLRTCDKRISKWSSSLWSCEITSCESIQIAEKTFFDCTNDFEIGSICTASCGRGYTLMPEESSNSAICTETGEWSSVTDWYCEEVQCPELTAQNIVLERISLLSSDLISFACTNARKFNSLCVVNCPLGYFNTGIQSVRCMINGKWSDGNFLCLPLQCKPLNVSENVLYACTNDNRVGSECQFSCTKGYSLVGANTTACRANQRWSGLPSQITCNKPSAAENKCMLEMDLSSGEMMGEQNVGNFVTVIHPPSLPVWKIGRSRKSSQCDYQSVIGIQTENITRFSLTMKFEVPRSFHFELSDSTGQDKSIQADGFSFKSIPGIPSQMIFPSKNEITFTVEKTRPVVLSKVQSSDQEQLLPFDFTSAKSVFIGVNRAVRIRHKYDIQQMGSGLCSLCVSFTMQ